MTTASEQLQPTEKSVDRLSLFGPGLLADFTRLTERYVDYGSTRSVNANQINVDKNVVPGSRETVSEIHELELDQTSLQIEEGVDDNAPFEVVSQEISDAEYPVTEWGRQYLVSIFGEDAVEALEPKFKHIDEIVDAFMKINSDMEDDEKKALYGEIARMYFHGMKQSEIADKLDIAQTKVQGGLAELKRRTRIRTKRYLGQNALVEAMSGEEWKQPAKEKPAAEKNDEEQKLSLSPTAERFVDSLFGSGTVQGLGLTLEDIEDIAGAISRIDWEVEDDDKRKVCISVVVQLLQGLSRSNIAKNLEISEGRIVTEIRHLKDRLTLRIDGAYGQGVLDEAIRQERFNAPADMNRIAFVGKRFVDSIYGSGTSESLALKLKDIGLVAAGMANSIYESPERKKLHEEIIRMRLQGKERRDIADSLGIVDYVKVGMELENIKRRLLGQSRFKTLDQSTLLDLMNQEEERILNESFEPLLRRPSRLPLSAIANLAEDRYYENIDDLVVDPLDDDEDADDYDILVEDGLCQQVDPGINTGEYVLNSIEAKQVCGMCHLSKICLEYALKNNMVRGIWGGASTGERREMRRAESAA